MMKVQGLCKSYGGRQVLYPVSFSLAPGQCLGVSGNNGSGKSTLLRLLAQIEQPDSGDIRFAGRSIRGDRKFLRTRLGYVPQDHGLMPDITVKQQLNLWQKACGISGPIPEELDALLGLTQLLPMRTDKLSGGMQRRVSIAMALLSQPDVLVMDEATTGLDSHYSAAVLDWLEHFLAQGGRMIWCSHDKAELDRLCGDCLYL